ncbi:MAG: hypothetical protein H7Y42_01750 [Chitinophagaceae bacterium]|nr:hypothetical protein [Chitinophagaceae bacterium]
MKITILSVLVVALFASTGCLSDSKSVERPQPVQPAQPVATSNTSFSTDTNSAIVPTTVSAPSIGSAPSKIAVNPAHGQPGHRCEFPVGAPLDGAQPKQATGTANTPAPSATTVTPVPIVTPPVAAPQQVAAGMNPAHGQPGHRCDIAVGAPLNGKPTQ